jgi:CrcB protein
MWAAVEERERGWVDVTAMWIGIGGALGTLARYGVATWAATTLGAVFPFGTLIVNVVGSFLISVVMTLATGSTLISPTTRLFLTTGVMGGFTTYSSFNYETLRLAQESNLGLAAANMVATVVGCVLAGLGGIVVGRWLIGGLT